MGEYQIALAGIALLNSLSTWGQTPCYAAFRKAPVKSTKRGGYLQFKI